MSVAGDRVCTMPNPPAEASDEHFRNEDWYAAELHGAEVETA